jgi:hypothetical protein
VKQTAEFLGKTLTDEQITKLCDHLSFKQMKENKSVNYKEMTDELIKKNISTVDGNFMRKGKSGSWREQISDDLAAKIDTWTESKLLGSDYKPKAFNTL